MARARSSSPTASRSKAHSSVRPAPSGQRIGPDCTHGVRARTDLFSLPDGLATGEALWTDSKSGSNYVGEFLEGRKHGQGILKDRDGSTFVGRFEKNMRLVGSAKVKNATYTGPMGPGFQLVASADPLEPGREVAHAMLEPTPEDDELFLPKKPEPEITPFGLKWEYLGRKPPAAGEELLNPDLADALQDSKTKFTAQEWASLQPHFQILSRTGAGKFDIADLRPEHYILAGARYYRAAGTPEGGADYKPPPSAKPAQSDPSPGSPASTSSRSSSSSRASQEEQPAEEAAAGTQQPDGFTHGSIVYDDGTQYTGEWVNGWRHGRGWCKWKDGRGYAGQWIRGQPEGPGKFTWPDGSWYHGEVVNGLRQGRGKLKYANGNVYEGDWEAGVKHGVGRWISNGEDKDRSTVYVGAYVNGLAEGHGSMSWPTTRAPKPPKPQQQEAFVHEVFGRAPEDGGQDGDESGAPMAAEEEEEPELPNTTYVGEFRAGQRHGKGTFTQPVSILVTPVVDEAPQEEVQLEEDTDERKARKKAIMEEVERKQREKEEADKAAGRKKKKKKRGVEKIEVISNVYEGEWHSGKYHGQGKLIKADGSEYEGEFRFDTVHGAGRYRSKDGDVYEGKFVQGQRHGVGKYTAAHGEVYDGEWNENIAHGYGKYIKADGEVYEGNFLGGHRTGKESKILYTNGDVYEGDVEDGRAYGVGVLMYADGETTFKGEFRMGKRHGKGTIINVVGGETLVTEGVWNRGQLVEDEMT